MFSYRKNSSFSPKPLKNLRTSNVFLERTVITPQRYDLQGELGNLIYYIYTDPQSTNLSIKIGLNMFIGVSLIPEENFRTNWAEIFCGQSGVDGGC